MSTKIDNILCTCTGAIVGLWQYILKIDLPTDFKSKALAGILTAFLGGAAGYIGKEVVRVAVESLKAYFANRKKKEDE